MVLEENQIVNDRRILGFPVAGLPSAATPILQFDDTNNIFIWVSSLQWYYVAPRFLMPFNAIEGFSLSGVTPTSAVSLDEVLIKQALTLKKLSLYISSNTLDDETIFQPVGGGTAPVLSIPALGTGVFDIDMTVAYAINERLSVIVNSLASTAGSISFSSTIGVEYN